MTTIRPLLESDLEAAQRLRAQAGWNQADDDWRRLLAWSPDGCWAAERDGRVVGTTAIITYGRRIAWIGMVLVDEACRRQGIGRALLTQAIEHLERLGIQTIALDSTPEGQPLYARLGFADAFELARWRGPIPDLGAELSWPPSPEATQQLRPVEAADLAAVSAYDARCFGVQRAQILRALQHGSPDGGLLAERYGQITGYVLSRPGARAWHLGPLAADNPTTAEWLTRATLLSATTGSAVPGERVAAPSDMVMDVVMPNRHAVALAEALGLALVRRFIRMTRGAPPPAIDLDRLYTSAGPELG